VSCDDRTRRCLEIDGLTRVAAGDTDARSTLVRLSAVAGQHLQRVLPDYYDVINLFMKAD
jgi:hypothetical protein